MRKANTILGVIGGLGPMATVYFMELVTAMTAADTDQEHLEMIVRSAPHIPDRTSYILDHTQESPLPEMLRIGNALIDGGAQVLAVTCMTAHYFYDDLQAGFSVPLVNGVLETARHLKAQGIRTAGIMATDGTVASGVFAKALEECGIQAVTPSRERQKDVMHLIYDEIKAGKVPQMARFHAVAADLRRQGSQAIILGCTELSLIKKEQNIGPGFIDAMEVLAQQSVLYCGRPLRPQYEILITK